MNPDYLILCATHFEISHFLDLCPSVSKKMTRTGLPVLSGRLRHKSYDLLITGPGVFNCAMALTQYLEKSSPDMVLQTGIAGAFKEPGLTIGDIAVATQEQYIHTGIQTETAVNDPLPFDLIDSIPLTRKGIYPFGQTLVSEWFEKVSNRLASHEINVFKGPFITVSTITSSLKEASRLYHAFSPVMEAMEGAAGAHISALYDIPFVEIRSASNFVGQRDKAKWDIDSAAKQLGLTLSLI